MTARVGLAAVCSPPMTVRLAWIWICAVCLTHAACGGSTNPSEPSAAGANGVAVPSAGEGTTEPAGCGPRAWLVMIDSSQAMKQRFGDVQKIAGALIEGLGGDDFVQVQFFDDVAVVKQSLWLKAGESQPAEDLVTSSAPLPAKGRHKALASIVEAGLAANPGTPSNAVLTVVVLTDGDGAIGSEADAARIGSSSQEGVIVLWFPRPMPEEMLDHAQQYARGMAGPRGLFVAFDGIGTDAVESKIAHHLACSH